MTCEESYKYRIFWTGEEISQNINIYVFRQLLFENFLLQNLTF